MRVSAWALSKPTSTLPLVPPHRLSPASPALSVPPFPALLASTKCTQAGSSVVVKSASTGSSPPYGLWGLRPTFRVPTKKSTVLLPLLSVPPFLIRHNRVVLSALRTGLRPSITRQR